jgi:REP element-mobilizing transposase RayT
LGVRAIVVSIVSVFDWQRGYRICAYAVMSNHTHVVGCVDKVMAESLSMEEVVRRWHQLYQGTLLSQKYQRGDKLSKGELISLEETVTIYRQQET